MAIVTCYLRVNGTRRTYIVVAGCMAKHIHALPDIGPHELLIFLDGYIRSVTRRALKSRFVQYTLCREILVPPVEVWQQVG